MERLLVQMLRRLVVAAHLAFVALSALSAQGTTPSPDSVVAYVRRALDAGTLDRARWPRITDVAAELRRAYDAAADSPLWFREGRPTNQAVAVVRYLAAIDSVGLDPADYDADALTALLERLHQGAGDADEMGRFEATLSVAAARALAALQWGRISPGDVHETFVIPRLDFDLARAVRAAAGSTQPEFVFDGAQPHVRPYVLLKGQLARYRALVGDSTLQQLPTFTRLAEGDRYVGAGALRRLLLALGDLTPASPIVEAEGDTIYSAELANAIRLFQERHGAEPDGIIGIATRTELLRPFRERVRQIELTLERWRWLPHEFGGRVIMVNIPEFRLYAFDRLTSDTTALFSMAVVVGEAYDHQTPIFMKEMEYIVFAPYWEVPASIMRKEIRPKAMRDPDFLARNRYILVRGYNERAPELPATASNIAQIGGALRVRQLPGPTNSLGRVKFMLPNRHNIYLHDTPTQQTFARFRRDVSHGCIRLADPLQLATWLLREDSEWPRARIEEAMARTAPLAVPLKERIPVLIVYGTAVVPLEGTVRFLPDIYRHDTALARLLARGYPYNR